MPLIQVTHRHLSLSRRNLDHWVKEQADLARAEHGFTFMPSGDAPSTYPALLEAYEISHTTGRPYPVSSANCDNTIFTKAETNWAMRFIHDLGHAGHQLSFSIEAELVLALHHLEALQAAGFGANSPEYKLLHADTIGQALCVTRIGRFPLNQRLFAYDCIDLGTNAAVELEADLTNPAA